MLKSWVRGERLVGEGETIGTGGSDGGGEIPAAGTDRGRERWGGEGGEFMGKKAEISRESRLMSLRFIMSLLCVSVCVSLMC